ncbi:TetR/AcrR family transcriptional regulator [Micromonospora sp. WMMD961]|uniref:TetR/AcrR family transcriptional regulator n=1 Tax=Micromonospora sp. WMMD961 TaxID=3016100 RepID=UPI00241669B3|nr:TetR/AcrR family transcriptional regulator [Micromonospora sp. WMMD961]MDG4782468.1 TetR/AcrR family transcriptional regulator [Micromonospora sp. WMMD961]
MARTATQGSRERILASAGALFYQHGVRAVGMSQVIVAAGCGKNLLYTHFASKNDLVAEYLRSCRTERDRLSAAAMAAVAGGDSATRLLEFVAEIATTVARPEFIGCAFRRYLAEFPHDVSEPARVARSYLRDTRAELDWLVAALCATDTDRLADRIWLVVEGLYASAANGGEAALSGAIAVGLVEELVNDAVATAQASSQARSAT